ncbi:MAG: nucleotide exchange factor GrpE [Clostridiales bacterium]|nr:nucleotide exchange factor GrpE [Clostridiales bacterium]
MSADEKATDTCEETSTQATEEVAQEDETQEDDAVENETKLDKKDLKIQELQDKYMRTFAEFDNFRKRSEKEKTAMFEVGAKSIVEKILPVVDNFERAFATVPEEDKENPFVVGMDKVFKQMITSLEEAGVKPIEAVGNEFNPDIHNAVMHIEDESFGENEVIEELQKGYMYRESVVRHSMVKVAN